MVKLVLIYFSALLVLCGGVSCSDGGVRAEKSGFAIYLLKEKEQKDVWRYATYLVDLERLQIEERPFITEGDIESFDQRTLRLKEEVEVPRPITGTGLYFVVVVEGEREFLGNFLTPWSSLAGNSATTQIINGRVKEITIPEHCKGLNTYLRKLYKEEKYRGK
jgi:hypothetical protein